MSALRKYPVFAAALLAVGIVVVAESFGVKQSWLAERGARRRLEQARRDLCALESQNPPPSPEVGAKIADELERAKQTLGEWQAALIPEDAGPPFDAIGETSRRPEAFFDLAAFVELMRVRAQQAGVVLRPDERFGFSTFAHEAPASNQLAEVARERLMLQSLLEALMDAQPHQLLSVQRERPTEPAGPKTPASRGSAPVPPKSNEPDYFDPDSRRSLQMPETIETTAFRLSFTGHTTTLRRFLNRLAEFESLVVMRSVEVALEEAISGKSDSPPTLPLVRPGWSKFIVTVEFITLAPTAVGAF